MPIPSPRNIKKIRLGICMAGAVSAGAYTAGVLDYLIEALDRWEQLKQKAREQVARNPNYQPQIPMHEVEIVVLSGASAGGMVAAIAARALAETIEPVTPERREAFKKAPVTAPVLHNLLYQAWVKMTDADMLRRLLGDGDLSQYHAILSLLNADFKDTLANTLLLNNPMDQPAQRPYVPEQLELLLTLSNFGGVSVKYPFRSADGQRETFFRTVLHQDFAHFSIGGAPLPGRILLDFKNNVHTNTLAQAAKATGAFPLGFEARKVERPTATLAENPFLKALWGQLPELIDPQNPNRPLTVTTLNTDGGMLNNEPFELTQQILDAHLPQEPGVFNILLMIDPFPDNEPTKTDLQSDLKRNLFEVIPGLLGTLLQQGRAKPRDIQIACSDDLGRFLIAPSRAPRPGSGERADVEGSRAIACGALGGFAGFIDESFREHDFLLGRKNCQRFLQRYFTVPTDFFDLAVWPVDARARLAISLSDSAGKSAGKQWPVLPDLGVTGDLTPLENPPEFPAYSIKQLDRYRKIALKRVSHMVLLILKPNFWQKFVFLLGALLTIPLSPFILLGLWLWLRQLVWKKIKTAVVRELKKWELDAR